MKTSIATVTLSGSLPNKLEAAADAGFDAVEIFDNDLIQFAGSPREVKSIADDLGLDILALQPFRDLEGLPAELKRQKFYHMQSRFEMMHELGTQRILCCSSVSPHASDDRARCAADLYEAAELAAKEGFIMGYEALSWGRFIADYEDAWDLVKRADHPALGINLDTFHMFSRGNTLDCLRDEIPVDKIALVQVADAPVMHLSDLMSWSRHYRSFPGQGDLPVVDFMKVLCDKGFDDYVSHEIFNDEFRASPAKERAVDGMRSLIWLNKQCKDETPKAEITDVEFIEFAIAGEEGESIVSMLNSLGFQETHKHLSKDVGLMQMGDVNLVLNREPASQAHQHFQLHGASVCALALTTSSVKESLKQADQYQIKRFNNTAGPGELNIPALRGVGDSLVYLVERHKKFRFFDVDFESVEGVELPKVGVKRVDHMAQSVTNTDFLSAAFFYKSVFNFDITPVQDLPDIYGLVTSRVASSQNGQVKIPINMTEARQASPQRFIQRTHGAGMQQIAFECEDVLAFAAQVNPESVLPVPNNYYREIKGKFGLSAERIETLQRFNILYDANDEGEFLHFYTREVQGVFFEVVQRIAGYQAYGEANAHIRFAAQAALREYETNLVL
ncbi:MULTISPECIES: bifunctional sugar phosphate isomerase/epimerase/4-hydroxyphenylpyruvate dioxygenase family protein [unclassified Marinobacterium]|uniref:bifunctional sugar phosphate isomerase/epimerase/4-hydroxyphenylpyruvate dioxygenase family protein n=1 Tax=unclassified Marinobacterium TaxID=2644139 RepID=UPI001568A129|nr:MULTISPECIES: sugar phosphate isomerase/epimerase and 4-hydroxyphenylpyruvate domain-containing protein [unclassified Marinobacterium]NRP47576.1 4-hydroxyphenylpyruvate dioxygenase [Marinobacterium sp. xm-d-543]NRQ23851.1 4-hydroxyphenylpyruvate dioxygenase [Marinobacterium sp. xm-m-312]